MKIIIKSKGSVKMSDAVKEHISEQVGGLEKLFNRSENVTVNVLLAEKNTKFTCEITIVLKHVVLRAECNGDTLYAAIDQSCDKIEQQLIRHKKKVNDIIKKREGISQYFSNINEAAEEEPVPEIKVKNLDIMEMSIDEAITEMELSDHEFYMFKNEATHTYAVVYKRKNGGYGLLQARE